MITNKYKTKHKKIAKNAGDWHNKTWSKCADKSLQTGSNVLPECLDHVCGKCGGPGKVMCGGQMQECRSCFGEGRITIKWSCPNCKRLTPYTRPRCGCGKPGPFTEFVEKYDAANKAEASEIEEQKAKHQKQVKNFVEDYRRVTPHVHLATDGKTLYFDLKRNNEVIEFEDGIEVLTVAFKKPCVAFDSASAAPSGEKQDKLTLHDTKDSRLLVRQSGFNAFKGTVQEHADSKKEENMRITNVFTPETCAKIAEKLSPGNYDVFFKLACDGKAHPDFTPSGRYTHHESGSRKRGFSYTRTLADIMDELNRSR